MFRLTITVLLLFFSGVLSRHHGQTHQHQHHQRQHRQHLENSTETQRLVTVESHHYNKHSAGRRVCTSQKEYTTPVSSVEKYCKPTFKKYYQRCFQNKICTGVRLVYETAYKNVVHQKTTTKSEHFCCPGWKQVSKNSHGCNKPVCEKECENGGTCIRPGTCSCPEGFTGKYCESDIDECSRQNKCTHICRNSIGSYSCGCREGFRLNQDRATCSLLEMCGGGCRNGGTCLGSNSCLCPKGFIGTFCENDIDECAQMKPCDQICLNNFGSYKCDCREDFVLLPDGQSCRKEDNEPGIEAKDLEIDVIDKRLHDLETVVKNGGKNYNDRAVNEISQKMNSLSNEMNTLNNRVNKMEASMRDYNFVKKRLNFLEHKTNRIDELSRQYDHFWQEHRT